MREYGHSNTLSRAASIAARNAALIPSLSHLTPDAVPSAKTSAPKSTSFCNPCNQAATPLLRGSIRVKKATPIPRWQTASGRATPQIWHFATAQSQEKQRLPSVHTNDAVAVPDI